MGIQYAGGGDLTGAKTSVKPRMDRHSDIGYNLVQGCPGNGPLNERSCTSSRIIRLQYSVHKTNKRRLSKYA